LELDNFVQTFNGKKWEKFNSEKVASLAYARIQGRNALISHFQNSSLMNEEKWCVLCFSTKMVQMLEIRCVYLAAVVIAVNLQITSSEYHIVSMGQSHIKINNP
jgi:hypothetical protein